MNPLQRMPLSDLWADENDEEGQQSNEHIVSDLRKQLQRARAREGKAKRAKQSGLPNLPEGSANSGGEYAKRLQSE